MRSTMQRDRAVQLAKTNAKQAHKIAVQIEDPWFKAQALASVLRYTEDDPLLYATQAAKAASECDDDYKRSAVRAWEIAALAERGLSEKARNSLRQATTLAKTVQPFSSRSEALYLLLQAAAAIGPKDSVIVNQLLIDTCPKEEHWRCKRALRDGYKIVQGDLKPRKFYH